jgi:cellulose 1,4-beta-cellobiosidase
MRHFLILVLLSAFALANTPGKHSVDLTWSESDTTVVAYNVYRGTATGVCSGLSVPYALGVLTKAYTDTVVTAGTTYFYAVSALNSAGVESACSAEAQAVIPSTTFPAAPGTPSVVVH